MGPGAACRCDHAFGITGLRKAMRAIFMELGGKNPFAPS
jgi:hypothetical protein